jgi:hypothetical protein
MTWRAAEAECPAGRRRAGKEARAPGDVLFGHSGHGSPPPSIRRCLKHPGGSDKLFKSLCIKGAVLLGEI